MIAIQIASISQAMRPSITSSPVVVRYASFPRRPRHHQQVRGFHFGHWSSYLDPVLQKELQRRHHALKHKYAEAFSRKLGWNLRLPAHASSWSLKGLMRRSWHISNPRSGGIYVNFDEMNSMAKNASPNRSETIEEVEQPDLNNLHRYREAQRLLWSDRSLNWNLVEAEMTPTSSSISTNSVRPNQAPRHDKETPKQCSTDEEYDIDPVSNRKVFRNHTLKKEPQLQTSEPSMLNVPVKTFKGYKPQFSTFYPPVEDEPERPIQLGGCGLSTYPEQQAHSNPEYSQNEFVQYKPFTNKNLDGKSLKKPDPVAEGLKEYDDRHEYKPFMYNEPDGKLPEDSDQVAEALKKYNHDRDYKPFVHNEPDGKAPGRLDSIERGSGGKLAGINSSNITGNRKIDANRWLSKASVRKTRDGIATFESRQALQEITPPDAKGSFGGGSPFNHSAESDSSQVYLKRDDKSEDLDLLRPSDVRAASGIIKEPRKETSSEKENLRASLEADFDEIQRPGKTFLNTEALQDKESRQIAIAFEIERSYLQNFIAHAKGYMETAKIELMKTTDKTERDYLLKRISYATERMEARSTQLAELEKSGQPSNHYEIDNWQSDAKQAGVVTHPVDFNRLTWNFSRDFPEEFDASWVKKGSSPDDCLVPKKDMDAWSHGRTSNGLGGPHQHEVKNTVHSAENDHATKTTVEDRFRRETNSARLEPALERSLKVTESAQPVEYDLHTKELKEVEKSYSGELKQNGTPGSPISISSYEYEKQKSSVTGQVESSDMSSKAPVETEEKISDKDPVQEVRGIYETAYGTINNKHRQPVLDSTSAIQAPQVSNEGLITSSTPGSSPPEPTIYKILAYDPSMQIINTAETTSIVTDTTAALTPAEVLIRLSNPAKFFPHFKPLQAQGYEIVSGSGDVLVFRKVREGANVELAASTSATPIPPQQVVNPIDGMQRLLSPATGNFASPTGFVNHDLPHEDRFISGIDVRREEPVFSGQKTTWQDGQEASDNLGRGPKKSRKRALLVGAAWVAACSYAVGVVAEYFKTGGSDGKGPIGF